LNIESKLPITQTALFNFSEGIGLYLMLMGKLKIFGELIVLILAIYVLYALMVVSFSFILMWIQV